MNVAIVRIGRMTARPLNCLIALVACVVLPAMSNAQSVVFPSQQQQAPIVRGTRGFNYPQGGASDLSRGAAIPQQGGISAFGMPRRHLNPLGQPCVQIGAYSRPQTNNPNIYDHLITTSNSCGSKVGIKACYYKSTRCIDINVLPYSRKESILGIFPSMKDFRYEFTEVFD